MFGSKGNTESTPWCCPRSKMATPPSTWNLGTKISMLPGISSKNLGCQGTSALPITTTTGRCSPRKATEMDAKQMVFNLGICYFLRFWNHKAFLPWTPRFTDFLPGNLPTICWALAPRSCKAWVKSTAFRLTRCFYFAMRAYKSNIEVDWSSHLFAVEMKNKMQIRHKGAQEIQRQSKGAGQSNVTTEFWSQLFPGFPRFQRKSSN